MRSVQVIVIGGGASGMMAAITASRAGKKVLLLEKMNRLGKKYWQPAMDAVILQMPCRHRPVTEDRMFPMPGMCCSSLIRQRYFPFSIH